MSRNFKHHRVFKVVINTLYLTSGVLMIALCLYNALK